MTIEITPSLDIVHEISLAMHKPENLIQARESIALLLTGLRKKFKEFPITYVIGAVTSDGPEHEDENLAILKNYTQLTRHSGVLGPFVFSAADVFDKDSFRKFNNAGAKNIDYINFWRSLIRSGLIDNIARTPSWVRSSGAKVENDTGKAKRLNLLNVQIVSDELVVTTSLINNHSRLFLANSS